MQKVSKFTIYSKNIQKIRCKNELAHAIYQDQILEIKFARFIE